jgi:hypothetical protein
MKLESGVLFGILPRLELASGGSRTLADATHFQPLLALTRPTSNLFKLSELARFALHLWPSIANQTALGH